MFKHRWQVLGELQLTLSIFLIFTITGIVLARSFIGTATSITSKDFGFSIVLYVMIHVGRLLTVIILYPLMKCTGVHLSWKDCIILIWSGLRGSMALILVLIVSLNDQIDLVIRNRFLFHVSMIVLLTLVINGTSSKFLVRILGLHHGTEESELILLQALEHMRRQTSWKLSKMKKDEQFADVNWQMLNEFLPDKLLEELDEENDTDFHQRLSTNTDEDIQESFHQKTSTDYELEVIPTVYQTDSIISSPITQTKSSKVKDHILPISNTRHRKDKYDTNIRNELIIRFLTAMSIDYEKQWYLGMIRRRTLDILIKSVEQAKQKCSLEFHWKSIVQHFHLTIFLRLIMKFNLIKQWSDQIFFDHIYRTIELTLSKHFFETKIKISIFFLIQVFIPLKPD